MKNRMVIIFSAVIFIVTIIPRFIILNMYSSGISNDSYEYLSLASNIRENGEFKITGELYNLKDSSYFRQAVVNEKKFPDMYEKKYGAQKTMFRDPGYPYFIAMIYKIFGEDYNNVSIIQILIQAVSAVLLFLSILNIINAKDKDGMKSFFIPFIAILILVSFHPGLIISSRNILRESFEIFLMVMIIYFFSVKPKAIFYVLAAVFTGILIFTLQSMKYLIYLAAVYFLVKCVVSFYKGGIILKDNSIKYLFIYIVVTIFLIQAWPLRNYLNFGIYKTSSFGKGAVLLINALETEKQAKPEESYNEFCNRLNVSDFLKSNFLKYSEPIGELRRTFLKRISTSEEELLITSDNSFKSLALQIYRENYKTILKNYVKALFGTLRIDHYGRTAYGKTGTLRYSVSFSDIAGGRIKFQDLISLGEWIIFLVLFAVFFVTKKIPVIIKILFLTYLLPYILMSSLGGVEDRVTLIFNIFICISFAISFRRINVII